MYIVKYDWLDDFIFTYGIEEEYPTYEQAQAAFEELKKFDKAYRIEIIGLGEQTMKRDYLLEIQWSEHEQGTYYIDRDKYSVAHFRKNRSIVTLDSFSGVYTFDCSTKKVTLFDGVCTRECEGVSFKVYQSIQGDQFPLYSIQNGGDTMQEKKPVRISAAEHGLLQIIRTFKIDPDLITQAIIKAAHQSTDFNVLTLVDDLNKS